MELHGRHLRLVTTTVVGIGARKPRSWSSSGAWTSDRRLLERFVRSEDRVVEALGDLQGEAARNTSRLDDMGEAIRANTQAVLSMLDRLGPATS